MRLAEIMGLTEMAAPSPEINATTYYHGTPHEQIGLKIIAEGIRPRDLTGELPWEDSSHSGRIYLTSNLQEAVKYATEPVANVHTDQEYIEKLAKKRFRRRVSRYGYLFTISGKKLINDVLPDEEVLAAAYEAAYHKTASPGPNEPGKSGYYYDHMSPDRTGNTESRRDYMIRKYMDEHPEFAKRFSQRIRQAVPNIKRVRFTNFRTIARIAPEMIAALDLETIQLLNQFAGIAYEGAVMPNRAYRIDKLRMAEMVSPLKVNPYKDSYVAPGKSPYIPYGFDAEKFWQVAEPVDLPAQ